MDTVAEPAMVEVVKMVLEAAVREAGTAAHWYPVILPLVGSVRAIPGMVGVKQPVNSGLM